GMDPYEWRAMNVARRGDQTLGPPLRKGAPLDAVCDRLLAISDYPRKRSSFELIRKRRPDPSSPPGYGIGLAFGPQRPATALSCRDAQAPSVEVTLSKDSTLTIRSSVASGSGAVTRIWKRIAATSLGLSPEAVEVATPSTDEVPDSGPNVFSRRIGVVTRLIGSACDGLASKRFREALPITVRKSQRARSAKAAPESPLDDASWGAAVVELELDPVDAAPTVRGIWLVAKAGRILSREDAAAALERDAAVALGLCVAECLDLSAGPVDPGDLRRYGLWRIKDAPPIQVEFVDDDAEPKGIGELAYSLVPAAFANALSQALDSPWNALPTCRRSEGVDDDS
ncbi:MAG TPA: molybdopterin-dependent oxidoreductase, partial [Spirochaetales bacterium]|nr:molybdopterin-dependent oxidoreductase [Spirochaetales bacterium]